MTHITRSVEWRAGAGTPVKYTFNLDVEVTAEVVSPNSALITLVGTCGVQNNPLNSRNSYAASDIALLTMNGADPWNYGFVTGTSYYKHSLPFSPSAPQSIVDAILLQFRGDTWRNDPGNSNNRSSLYYKPSGVVLDTYDGSNYQSFSVNTSFSIDITGGGNKPILVWTTSGCSSSTDYSWVNHETWLSWFDIDYRPGERKINGVWKSHDRNGGVCDRKGYGEMRTLPGTGNPPSRKINGVWVNQSKIGAL